jgi:hypothetical protein
MRNILTVALTAGFVVLGAAAANADTSVYNKYSNTVITNGYTETDVDAHIYSESTTVTDSLSIKAESYGGTTNVSSVTVTDHGYQAGSYSANTNPTDPVAIVTVVDQHDTTFSSETVKVDTFSSNNFSGTVYEHEAGNRY